MNKWIPYVIAAVLGLGVAVLAFGPGMGGGDKAPTAKVDKPEKEKRKVQTTVDMGDKGFAVSRPEDEQRTPEEIVADAIANPPPPPGTLRPQNKAEIEHAAKLARPFNQHFAHVSAFWSRAAQLTGKTDPALSKECSAMTHHLRDQGNMTDDEIDIQGTIQKEFALVEKVRAATKGDEEVGGVLDYIQESGQAVLDGKDPTTVLKPSAKKAAGG